MYACGFSVCSMDIRPHKLVRLIASLVAVSAMAEEAEPCRVRVIEGRAAVFASTNAVREALAWLPSGTEFVVRGELTDGAWVCVEPPDHVSVWIYRELVRDGVVLADKSRLRSGAGLTFRPVGSLNKGDRVEVRGSYGDWLRIKPPPEVCFWMLRDQVEPLAAMQPEGADTNLTAEVGVVSVTNAPVFAASNVVVRAEPVAVLTRPVPAELRGYVLDNTQEQGVPVMLSGILDWGTVGAVAAPFCLVARQADGDTAPVCHLMAPALTYSPHVGSTVSVEGTRWRVKGSDLPVVIPSIRFTVIDVKPD